MVTTFQVAELFEIAYTKTATAQTAINGFKKTGLFPTILDSEKNDQLNESAFITEILTDLPSNKFSDKSNSQLLTLMQTPQSQPIPTQESNQAGRKKEITECNPNASHIPLPLHRRTYHHMQLHLLQKHLQDLVENQKHDVDLLLF